MSFRRKARSERDGPDRWASSKSFSFADVARAKIDEQKVDRIQNEKPSRYVIDPRKSRFIQTWDAATTSALLFTALVTPFGGICRGQPDRADCHQLAG